MSNAINGVGTIFSRWDTTLEEWVTLEELLEVTPLAIAREAIEVTSAKNISTHKEFIPGWTDSGSIEITLNYSKATLDMLIADSRDTALQTYSVTLPDDTFFEFTGFITELPFSITVSEQLKIQATIKVSDQVEISERTYVPTVTTSMVDSSAVTSTTAIVGGTVVSNGGLEVMERGVAWGSTENPTISGDSKIIGAGTGIFSDTITELSAGTLIYVRAYAINEQGIAYGTQQSFTTEVPVFPIIETVSVSDLVVPDGVVTCDLVSIGAAAFVQKQIVWERLYGDGVSKSVSSSSSALGQFSKDIDQLADGTWYQARGEAENANGISYGEWISFVTGNGSVAVVSTIGATWVGDETTATFFGFVDSNGLSAVTERGFVWNGTGNPTVSDTKIINGSGVGAMTSQATGLPSGDYVFVRAYAINSEGTVYGQSIIAVGE